MSITTTTSTSQNELTSLRAAIAAQAPVPTGSVTMLDRLAMRVGLALILWSRGHTLGTPSSRIDSVDGSGVDWRSLRQVRQQRPFC